MAKLKVDGLEIEVPDHFTLLQAAVGGKTGYFCCSGNIDMGAKPLARDVAE